MTADEMKMVHDSFGEVKQQIEEVRRQGARVEAALIGDLHEPVGLVARVKVLEDSATRYRWMKRAAVVALFVPGASWLFDRIQQALQTHKGP